MVKQIIRFLLFALVTSSAFAVSAVAQPTARPSPAIKVRNILSFVRANTQLNEEKNKLGQILGIPDIPDRMYVCASPFLRDQDCKPDLSANELRIAYAGEEKGQELDVLVLARRTPTEGYFYLVSPQDVILRKAVHVKKIVNGETVVEVKSYALDIHDHEVLRDFQEQLDFWNDKYEKWVTAQKKP